MTDNVVSGGSAAAPSLGAVLKQWRTERGLSLRQAATKAGLSASTVGRWEREECLPRLPELEAVLTALQVSSAQRRQALTLLEAPRAVFHLRRSLQQEQPEWVDLLGLPPGRGELLRAMRLRSGRTLDDTARATGVTASTLSRWERGEVWPPSDKLHALCWTLCAHTAEVEALTCGRQGFLPSLRQTDREALQVLARSVWFGDLPDGEALRDLYFTSLHAHLWQLASHHAWAGALLGELFAYYARALMERQRPAEACLFLERASQLTSLPGTTSDTLSTIALVGASLAVEDRSRPDRKLAVRYLRQGLKQAKTPAYRAWMLSEAAQHLAQEGQVESAVALSRRAQRVVLESRDVNEEEFCFRGYDHAQTLLLAGKAGDTLDAIASLSSHPYQNTYLAARWTLLEAEALLKLGNLSASHTRLSNALSAIDIHNFYYLRPQADALTNQF